MVRPIALERIRAERLRMGLTQEELGKKFGKSKSYISQMETQGQHFSVEMLERLVDIFGCTTDYLLGRTDKRT